MLFSLSTVQNALLASTALFSMIPGTTAGHAKLRVSTNGRCGNSFGLTCLGSDDGPCCSQYNYCGSSDAYCLPSKGCQSGFGTCGKADTKPPTSIKIPIPSTIKGPGSLPSIGLPSGSLKVSKNGRCGSKFGTMCLGAKEGDCCSEYGYCGKTSAYCLPSKGCQSKFGLCGSKSSSSSFKTSTTSKTASSEVSSTLTTTSSEYSSTVTSTWSETSSDISSTSSDISSSTYSEDASSTISSDVPSSTSSDVISSSTYSEDVSSTTSSDVPSSTSSDIASSSSSDVPSSTSSDVASSTSSDVASSTSSDVASSTTSSEVIPSATAPVCTPNGGPCDVFANDPGCCSNACESDDGGITGFCITF